MEDAEQLAGWLLGLGAEEPSLGQMAARAVVVYAAALIMVRWGEKRFMGKSTAFDVILGVILGSVISRAINGSAPFLPTLGAGFVLVGLHWLFASLAFRSDWFGTFVKGHTRILVKDGKVDWDEMRKSHMSRNDLLGALRLEGVRDLDQVAEARLERSGDVSVVKAEQNSNNPEAAISSGSPDLTP